MVSSVQASSATSVMPSTSPTVSVLIPTTSQAERLGECLGTLAERLPASQEVEVVVAASAPTPAVERVLANCRGPRLRVVESGENLGVAGGFNRAREAARGELLCLIHDDTLIAPGWIEAMTAAAATLPDTAVFASVVRYPDGRLQAAGCLVWEGAVTTAAWPEDDDPSQLPAAAPVDYGPSCALAVRAELFDAIGGFDERLHPGYFVDADCAFACRAAGRLVQLVPGARAVHHRGSSSSTAFRGFLMKRNGERFLAKWEQALKGRPPVDDSPAGLAAGRARAAAEARALLAGGRPARPLIPRFALDGVEQEERLRRAQLEVLRDYTEHLEGQLAGTTTDLRWLKEQVLALAQRAGVVVERDSSGLPRFERVVAQLAARLGEGATEEPAAVATSTRRARRRR